MAIIGNAAGASMLTPKSFILEDENGNSFVGVTVGEETILTATDNDVRENLVYAGDAGVSTGTKVIPSYNTYEGCKVVPKGSQLTVPHTYYDYTKFQAIICTYNTNLNNSVAAEKVSINNGVYNVGSTETVSMVTKDIDNARVDLGVVNDSDSTQIIRYFMYKEVY